MKILFFLCVVSFSFANAQLADYNFDSNTDDQLNNYDPSTIFGSLDFSSGEYAQLDSGEYIVLPNALNNAFDNTESLEIDVRFKVEGDWQSTPALDGFGEEARIILTTKDEYDQRIGGFDITAREWENNLWITTTFGDGIDYDFGWTEGKRDFVAQIDVGIWYDLRIKFVFDDQQPYIQYIVNGSSSFSYYPDQSENQFAMSYEGFRETIDQKQIVIGSTLNNTISNRDANHPSLDLQLDHLTISSPAQPGDPTQVASTLQALIDHMNSSSPLTTNQLDSVRDVFAANWDDNSYDANTSIVHEYMSTFSDTNGFVFTLKYSAEDPSNFSQLKAIQFQIQQWILDNKYSAATVNDMEGLVFKEHERFPGTVSASAARLNDATFTVDGDYQTDPGFYLNDQEYVRRPTGFYAAPGELVSIIVPDAIIGQGLTVYVGAHRKNLQETWNELRRFPRVSTQFPLDSKTVTISNPFGGGVYIAIPDGNQFGTLTFGIDGAVKAPYYSTKPGFTSDLGEFMSEIQKNEVPWVDMESANFMTTIPNGMASLMTDPDSVLAFWNKSFDAINVALGRSQQRFRGEYLLVDRQGHVKYTAAPAAYPMSIEVYEYPYEDSWGAPVDVESGRDWYNSPQAGNYILFHEYGHLHNMPTLSNEQETNVHLLATVAYNQVMGESIDSAFVYAFAQKLNLEQATFDWILTPNFYNAERIGYEPNNPWDQLLYQSRGMVKLADIGKMFGWEALGEINKYFYDYQITNPNWSPYELQDDQLIQAASEQLGINMAPHFEFHGIIPSQGLVDQLKDMPASDVIKDRILHYRTQLPKDNQTFQPLYNAVIGKMDQQFHGPRWDSLKVIYDEVYASRIVARVDTILSRYYDLNETDFNDKPVITGLTDSLVTNIDTPITLSLNDFSVSDQDNEYPTDFTLTVYNGENYSFSEHVITPSPGFTGYLSVAVTVNDGLENSEEYLARIRVNYKPTIAGLTSELATTEGLPLTLSIDDFVIEDSDNNSASDFTLTIYEGDNYTLSENVVTPDVGFIGDLSVPVSVNDGMIESEQYLAIVRVLQVLGIDEELINDHFSIHPNPVEDLLTVEMDNTVKSYVLTLSTIQGKIVYSSGQIDSSKKKIDLSQLDAGVFILQIMTEDRVGSIRLIKN